MKNKIVVYDFETSGVDPNSCQIFQIAAVPIHSQTLEIQSWDSFNHYVRPTDFDVLEEDNLKWHANNKNITVDEFLATLRAAPTAEVVMNDFVQYINKFNWKQNKWTAPIRAGHNILRFDDIILDRVCKSMKLPGLDLFNQRDFIDTMHCSFLWFESLPEPKKYNMDDLRVFFGFDETSKAGAHDALQDCIDVAKLAVRFIKLTRAIAPKVQFKGALSV